MGEGDVESLFEVGCDVALLDDLSEDIIVELPEGFVVYQCDFEGREEALELG